MGPGPPRGGATGAAGSGNLKLGWSLNSSTSLAPFPANPRKVSKSEVPLETRGRTLREPLCYNLFESVHNSHRPRVTRQKLPTWGVTILITIFGYW